MVFVIFKVRSYHLFTYCGLGDWRWNITCNTLDRSPVYRTLNIHYLHTYSTYIFPCEYMTLSTCTLTYENKHNFVFFFFKEHPTAITNRLSASRQVAMPSDRRVVMY